MHNTKKNIIVAIALTLFFAKQVAAQTTVLGVTLGKTTYHEAIAKLPEAVRIKSAGCNGSNEYIIFPGGYGILTDNADGYGIDGLRYVDYSFDAKEILQSVLLSFEEYRFDDIKKILASKYKQVRSPYPDGFMVFNAKNFYVILYYPWNQSFTVDYRTPAYHREKIARIRRGEQNKKDLEREVKEEHKRQLAKEAEKL